MSWLRRLLGLDDDAAPPPGSTDSVQRIAERLEAEAPGHGPQLAAFAYVLARVAQSDLRVEDAEVAEMERLVASFADVSGEQARLVVELAQVQARDHGATEDYLVTREFRASSTREERVRLVECLFAVAAADGSISTRESNEALAVAEELGFSRSEAIGLRSHWREHLEELRGLPHHRGGGGTGSG